MIGLDCNILVQLAFADHPANAKALGAVQREALDWIEDFLANPGVRLLEPNASGMDQALTWMRQFKLGRKRILDTYLAAVLHTNGVRRLLTANPADFSVFGVLEIVTA